MSRLAKAERRLGAAAGSVPAGVRLCNDLREAITSGAADAVLLALVEELAEVLLGLEDAVGVHTPQALFD
jgi:hypothetical protein